MFVYTNGKEEKVEFHNPTLRVIKILEALMGQPEGMTLTEISKTCDMPKGSISPIIHTLAACKFLKADTVTGKYSIGIRCYEIGNEYLEQMNVSDEIREITKKIVSKCSETTHFAIRDGQDVVYLMKQDSSEAIRMVSSTGKRIPAYSTAIGKALLSGLTDEEVRDLYQDGLKKITENTITDLSVLCGQLYEVRNTKIAYETEESSLNITCIAMPIEKNGEVVAGISVSIPIFRATEEKKELVKNVLAEARHEIETMLRTVPFHF